MFKQIGGVAFGFATSDTGRIYRHGHRRQTGTCPWFCRWYDGCNGKSGFLGALVAGFVAGYLILALRKACDKLPTALEKIAPVLIYPVVGILVMGFFMMFIVEPIMGGINTGLNNALTGMGSSSKVVLGLVLSLCKRMAIDQAAHSIRRLIMFSTKCLLRWAIMIS